MKLYRKSIWWEVRMHIAERLMLWAIQVMPEDATGRSEVMLALRNVMLADIARLNEEISA